MAEAVIVEAVRSPVGKRNGGLSGVHAADLSAQVLNGLVERTGIDPGLVDDVIWGCVSQAGEQAIDIARTALLTAGWPETVPGVTVDRQCGSSQQSIHFAAAGVVAGHYDVVVAGGVESISCVQDQMNRHMIEDAWLAEHRPGLYVPMVQTAENVAARYGVSKHRQDEYGAASQAKATHARATGRFDDEIAPLETVRSTVDRTSGEVTTSAVTVSQDEGIRPDTTMQGVQRIRTVQPGGSVSAGNASQFTDGASACVVMGAECARQRGLDVLGIFKAFAVAGCEPDEMGVGPAVAVPKLLAKTGLSVADIDLWELNEAFAAQVIH
jgi:acetyl-CoA C-acetyltransferase